MSGTREGRVVRALSRWFAGSARVLPWRTEERDAYHVLVSELMLQQTQVSRVIPKFEAFVSRFPSVHALASASEREVLEAWTGLGYYRRARMLHAAARSIVELHAGRVPRSAAELIELPGIGRYTAGAIASQAFGARVPVVDGNVVRVLLRIEGRDGSASEAGTMAWCWERAGALQEAAARARVHPGTLNEAIMELGATVCVPRAPKCAECPLRTMCEARRLGRQVEIPSPKVAARVREIEHIVLPVTDGRGMWLVRRRAGTLWHGLWELPTVERAAGGHRMSADVVERSLGLMKSASRSRGVAMEFSFKTSACVVAFVVRAPSKIGRRGVAGEWVKLDELKHLAMSSPQRRIVREVVCRRA
ncbi:MAG: A/G-specific adenine glycosylase [Phycisphaerales bacterium]|nr:MAG: A/G-specific adenine glycosylase [Phycisphaerales bacterium]